MHFDLFDPVAAAGFAAPAFDIKTKTSGLIPAHFGFRQLGEQITDIAKNTGVGRRIGTRGAADGRLVDHNDLINMLYAFNLLILARESPWCHKFYGPGHYEGYPSPGWIYLNLKHLSRKQRSPAEC